MRLVMFGLALALAAVPAALPAQAPLAPGEVLLELGSIGSATGPADLAMLTVHIGGRGNTEAAARAERDARYQRVVAAARQAGVPAAAITDGPHSRIEDLRTFDVMEMPLPDGAPAAPPPPSHFASRSAIVRVTDMARVETLRAALIAAAETEPSNAMPVYSLTDSRSVTVLVVVGVDFALAPR
jgi:hypothetical protein